MINPFQWENGKAMTPEEVERARQLADAALGRAGDTSPVGHWTQGAARVIDTLGGVLKEKRASKAEAAGLAGADAYVQGNPVLAALLGGGGRNYATGGGMPFAGGGAPPAAQPAGLNLGTNVSPEELAAMDAASVGSWNPGAGSETDQDAFRAASFGQSPVSQYSMGESQNPIAAKIVETANAIGMAPEDLATIISYETAGTFDPTKAGPTTQWGQHRGLIQFGEPQAAEYGVDWNDPIGSQLGADGAVARYFTKNGWQPGMGLLDAYSIVNAGGPGRYNASDANNGGAPGTVADKVNNQMGGHREKALALLGGEYTPAEGGSYSGGGMSSGGSPIPMSGGGANVTSALMAAMSDPWVAKKYGPVLEVLMGQEMKRGDMQYEAQLRQSDPMYQAQLKAAEAALQPAPMKPIEVGGVLLDPVTYQPIFDSRSADPGFTMLTPDEVSALGLPPGPYQRGADGKIIQVGGGGTNISVNTGGGPEMGKLSPDFGYVLDPVTRLPVIDEATGLPKAAPVPGSPAALAAEDAARAGERAAGNADTASDGILAAATRAREAAKERLVGGLVGKAAALNPGSKNAEVYRQVDVLKSNAKISNLQAMRDASKTGGALGAVTAPELKMLEDKSGALDPASPYFERDLADYTLTLLKTVHGPEAGQMIFDQQYAGMTPPAGATGGNVPAGVDPSDWEFMTLEERALFQ